MEHMTDTGQNRTHVSVNNHEEEGTKRMKKRAASRIVSLLTFIIASFVCTASFAAASQGVQPSGSGQESPWSAFIDFFSGSAESRENGNSEKDIDEWLMNSSAGTSADSMKDSSANSLASNEADTDTSKNTADASNDEVDTSKNTADASNDEIDTSKNAADASNDEINTSKNAADASNDEVYVSNDEVDASDVEVDTSNDVAAASDNIANSMASNSGDDLTGSMAEGLAGSAAEGPADSAAEGSAGSAAEGSAGSMAEGLVGSAAEGSADSAAEGSAGSMAEGLTGSPANGLAGGAVDNSMDTLAEGLPVNGGSDTLDISNGVSGTVPSSNFANLPDMTVDEMTALAERLSTTEHALALDFDWALDYVCSGGTSSGRVITDPGAVALIDADAQPLIDGGWKAFLFTAPGVYGSDVERYFNVQIDTSDGGLTVVTNWKYLFDPSVGSTIEESGTDTFKGSFDPDSGTATVQSNYAKIDFDAFYLSADGSKEYALGTFFWISGETDRIALMR